MEKLDVQRSWMCREAGCAHWPGLALNLRVCLASSDLLVVTAQVAVASYKVSSRFKERDDEAMCAGAHLLSQGIPGLEPG